MMRKEIGFVLLLAMLVVSCQSSASGQIAFVSNRNGNYEIYVMNEDGSALSNISNDDYINNYPSWSPDGRLLAFTSSAEGIKVFDTNSENFVFASGYPSDDQFSWAPDSAQIAFHSLRNRDNRWEIFSVNLNGNAKPQQLTRDPARDNACAVWSPNGEYIAFASGVSRYVTLSIGDLFLMQSDGSGIEWLARGAGKMGECPYFSWSPDSQRIAMKGSTDLMIVSIPNGTITLRVEGYCPIGRPVWSPNGKSVAFVSDFCTDSPDAEIFVLDLATQNITQLTDNTAEDYFPVWSPDGKQIAFVTSRDGNEEVYLMQVDGSHQINLTNNPARDFYPSWRP